MYVYGSRDTETCRTDCCHDLNFRDAMKKITENCNLYVLRPEPNSNLCCTYRFLKFGDYNVVYNGVIFIFILFSW
jgi:hypothetical protein